VQARSLGKIRLFCALMSTFTPSRGWLAGLAVVLALGCTTSQQSDSDAPDGKDSDKPAAKAATPRGIAAGAGHTCVLRESGSVACWGANAAGQLGDGTTVDRSTPVTVQGLGDAKALALGRSHSCAIRQNGVVVCWGANDKGQLGSGNDVASMRPLPVRGLTDATAIAAGDDHTCALRADAAVVCWGNNRDGQLGNLTRNTWTEPAQIRGLADATALVAGSRHTCALRQTGTAICWGANEMGQLGDGTTNGHERASAVADLTGLSGLAAAGSRTCAFTTQAVFCWGDIDGAATPRPRKITERSGADNIAGLELGPEHACLRQQAGSVRCWGQNRDGRLGNGSFDKPAQATAVQLPPTVDLALGLRHSCALSADDEVRCWGDDAGGALGRGESDASAQQRDGVAQVVNLDTAIDLDAGDAFACAVEQTGAVVCWGRNDQGQLGDGSGDPSRAFPAAIDGLSDAVAIAAGPASACAVRKTGAVVCWGANDKGQLGRAPGPALTRPSPIAKLDDATAVTLGHEHGCAVRRSGEVYCWGSDAEGQLGDGAGSRGGKVAALADAVALGSGRAHTCALRRSGAISCWGANNSGQLGNGAGAAQLKQPGQIPVGVAKVDSASEIAIGPEHGCARLREGKVVCWGRNDAAQLGSGTSSNVWTSRVPAQELANVTALGVGPIHACAAMGQRVACWGDNAAGQGGFAGPSAATARVGVQGLDVASLALGRDHTCARLRSGGVACWGSNEFGQLGDGGRVLSPTPMEVVGL
jgi:alpha-tubulin suppressor-like RCC1 family protein